MMGKVSAVLFATAICLLLTSCASTIEYDTDYHGTTSSFYKAIDTGKGFRGTGGIAY